MVRYIIISRILFIYSVSTKYALLLKTNAIIHPAVFEDFIAWSEAQNKEVVACETAILFESGMVSYFDSILMVSAPLEIRIERCIKRNNFTREQVLERIAKQMDESKKIELSDFVIDNDNRKALYPQLKNFLNNLKA